jgi:hypothetical protein
VLRARRREIGHPGGGIRRPGFPISHAISLPRGNGPPASSDMSYWRDAQATEVDIPLGAVSPTRRHLCHPR